MCIAEPFLWNLASHPLSLGLPNFLLRSGLSDLKCCALSVVRDELGCNSTTDRRQDLPFHT
jgi:hypothetical protein